MKWVTKAVGVRERVPVLLADDAAWRTWSGSSAPDELFDEMQGASGVVELGGKAMVPFEYEGGIFDVGVGETDVIVLQHYDYADEDRDPSEKMRAALAAGEHADDEQESGTLELTRGLVIGDSWADGSQLAPLCDAPSAIGDLVFGVPRSPGKYVVRAGQTDDFSWYRIRPA